MSELTLYAVRNWDNLFEVAQSRRNRKSHSWVAMPNKHDGKTFRRLMDRADAVEVYGAWCLIVQVASKCPTRGVLADADGPLTADDLSLKTGGKAKIFEKSLEVLSSKDIGWLSRANMKSTDTGLRECSESAPRVLGPTVPDRTLPNHTIPDLKLHSSEATGTPPSESPPPLPPVMDFPCVGEKPNWELAESQRADWAALFPDLDILAECRAAKAWLAANSERRKTANGMRRFLVGWFTRTQNRRGGKSQNGVNGRIELPMLGVGEDE